MRPQIYLSILLIWFALVLVMVLRSGKVPWARNDYDSQKLLIEAVTSPKPKSDVEKVALHRCSDKTLGVNFLCDFGWQQRKTDNVLLLTVNTDPDVTIRIVKIDMDILSIHQLSRDKLESLSRYANGFVIEEGQVAGSNAMKVKAFSKTYPDTRLCDYYFVHNKKLYGLMFSVNPKTQWDEYKFVFRDVVESFQFRN